MAANSLRAGSDNYTATGLISRADGAAVGTPSGTAFLYSADDATKTPLANSSISLAQVGSTKVLAGTWPASVPLVVGVWVTKVYLIADSNGGVGRIEIDCLVTSN